MIAPPKIPGNGPASWRKWAKEITDFSYKIRVISGPGALVSETSDGRSVSVPSSSSSSSSSLLLHPFKTYLRADPDNPELYQAKVFLGSNLYNGLGNWATTAIVGLGAWFSVVENVYVYLTGTYSGEDLTSVDVDSGSTLPGRIVISTGGSPAQMSWTTRIARIVASESGGLTVEQNLFQHLTIIDDCVGSVSVHYPFPVS